MKYMSNKIYSPKEKSTNNNITIIINFESTIRDTFNCDKSEKIETVLAKFCSKNNLEINSILVLYDGKLLSTEEYKKSLQQIIKSIDKKSNQISILIYKKIYSESDNEFINMMLIINSEKVIKIKGKRNETLKSNLEKNISKIGSDLDKLIFNYRNNEIDINKKFEDIADQYDKRANCLTLNIDSNIVKVNFLDKNGKLLQSFLGFENDQLGNICNKYCIKAKGLNIEKSGLIFKFQNEPINLENTINKLSSSNESSMFLNSHERIDTDVTQIQNENNYREIDIYVFDNNKNLNQREKNKIPC